jgi:hypothetical protein
VIKHNKKRNTAFLFEVLIQEASKALVENNRDYHDIVIKTIQESFGKSTELKKELAIYLSITNHKDTNKNRAYRLIEESMIVFNKIDKKKIFAEQSALINKINKNLNEHVFSNFVENYRVLGNIYHLLNSELTPVDRVNLKENISNYVCEKDKKTNILESMDSLTYKIFVDKFNEKFSKKLNENQVLLVRNYIFSVHDKNTGLKVYLESEIPRLKKGLSTFLSEGKGDKEVKEKVSKVVKELENISEVNESVLIKIMKIQTLVEEIYDDNY